MIITAENTYWVVYYVPGITLSTSRAFISFNPHSDPIKLALRPRVVK